MAGRIVITGARGYIGHALASSLARDGHALRLVSRPSSSWPVPAICPGDIDWVFADLRDDGGWTNIIADADAVVHLSARADLREAENDPVGDDNLNVEPVRALVRAATRLGRADLAVILASTVTIVGCRHDNPVDESTPDDPASVYDRHKLACERILAEACRGGVLRACSLRLANVYGFGASSSGDNRGILNAMVKRAAKGEPITMYGDGRHVRDFVHLDDIAGAFRSALHIDHIRDGRHYVIASGIGRTLLGVFELVAAEAKRRTGVTVEVRRRAEPLDTHPIERRDFVGNSALFRDLTGWIPVVGFEDGIRNFFDQALGHPKTASQSSERR